MYTLHLKSSSSYFCYWNLMTFQKKIRADLDDEFLEIPCTSIKRVFAGLLLRQIKDFWRVALLTSTLLNPALDPSNYNLDRSEGLGRRTEMFLRTESAITQLDVKQWEYIAYCLFQLYFD